MHNRTRTGIMVLVATAAWSAHAVGAVDSTNSVILTPNTITGAAPPVTLGNTTFTNLGLQGVGRVDAAFRDAFGETFGSVSSLQLLDWGRSGNSYTGSFYTLPDRGFNVDSYFSFYEARVQQVDFVFTPYTGAGPTAQDQIAMTYVGGTKFTYPDGIGGFQTTTGVDPGSSVSTLFGKPIPFSLTQTQADGSVAPVNRLAIDAEGLVLHADGSGYLSDEYGPYVYKFDADKRITAILPIPDAILPHAPAGTVNFQSAAAGTNGRRNNQGMEGLALSPDGTKLYALLQSATVQDTNGSQQQTRLNTRLLVYDVSGGAVPTAVEAEYVLQLPTFDVDGSGGPPDRTAAQSEIVALSDGRLLVLSRDGNGYGTGSSNPTMFKSILLVDLNVASPTDIVGNAALNAEGGQVSPGGVLAPSITPLSWVEALNMLNLDELAKFGFNLDNANPDKSTLSEKWEGLALVPALDPENPYDYFLFIANDNDFNTTYGRMLEADGGFFDYDAGLDNDTVFLAYRVRIAPVPEPQTYAMMLAGLGVLGWLAARRRRG